MTDPSGIAKTISDLSVIVIASVHTLLVVMGALSLFFNLLANTLPKGSKWQSAAHSWGAMIVTGWKKLRATNLDPAPPTDPSSPPDPGK
jgi:hypothetical protein